MSKALSFCMFLSFVSFYGNTQSPAAAKALKDQAVIASQSLVKKDYKTFCHYAYPKLITMAGGETKMIQTLQQTMDQIKTQGVEILNFSFEEPGKAYKVEKGWQSSITQHTKLKTPNGKIITTSTLLAFSSDGKSWTFMDTNNKDIATVRKIVPELSPSITIPPPQAPVQSAN